MKRLKTIILLVTTLVFVTACGMTQELDESLTVTKNLDTALTEEKQVMKDLLTSVDAIIPSFDKDMENGPKTGLFVEEEGALYKNYQTRQDLLKEIQAGQKNLNKYKREVERISGKNAVDVNHEQLDLISSSLQIIINNYDSLIMYMKTGFEQEEALYTSLPVDNLEDQGSVINRTYGSVTMVAEEAKTNMSYTLSLVKNYQKDASVPKK
ncbi:hypothetical protein DOK76_09810 [Vagococcus sp. DIV0080]|uniref:Lipoprotein n=1 Tax=Candidatus Vagococcus giribetii TaxID=2230876 RepID=A0ABS3HUD3_9ENTE|nr:hypothetical protein [Vagococcus sp. DIV0080]MBO0477369.1 hypothetical protein [Vagococcus sp. DIV0080]